ncbi:MAG: DUF3127 domain-containing protein [Xanthomonadales bacterium]|jgi:hypothetical protein|nr:DUF3127 domain-containing protein [Xanthomonadales bacterium]
MSNSNKYEATGTLKVINDIQQFSETFRKREFVIEVEDGAYTQPIKFQAVQDKAELLDAFEEGDTVTVNFNLRGREFTRKNDGSTDYFVNLDVWRIEKVGGGASDGPPKQDEEPPLPEPSPGDFKDDDIPF